MTSRERLVLVYSTISFICYLVRLFGKWTISFLRTKGGTVYSRFSPSYCETSFSWSISFSESSTFATSLKNEASLSISRSVSAHPSLSTSNSFCRSDVSFVWLLHLLRSLTTRSLRNLTSYFSSLKEGRSPRNKLSLSRFASNILSSIISSCFSIFLFLFFLWIAFSAAA